MRPRQNVSERKSRKHRKRSGKPKTKRPTNWLAVLCIFFIGCLGSYFIFQVLGEKRGRVKSLESGGSGNILNTVENIVDAKNDIKKEAMAELHDLNLAKPPPINGYHSEGEDSTEEIPSDYHSSGTIKEVENERKPRSAGVVPPAMPPLIPTVHDSNNLPKSTVVRGGCNLDPADACK